MKHVWIGDNRYLVTDNFDGTEGSEDMVALSVLNDHIASRVSITPEQAARQDEAMSRFHERNHARFCCAAHGTHSMPHRGCVLR